MKPIGKIAIVVAVATIGFVAGFASGAPRKTAAPQERPTLAPRAEEAESGRAPAAPVATRVGMP